MNKIIGFLKNNRGFLIFLGLLFLVRGSIIDWHPVPTGSMKPTILEGDVIVQNKLAYDLRLPFTDTSLMLESTLAEGVSSAFSNSSLCSASARW